MAGQHWPDHLGDYLRTLAINTDDLLDAAERRINERFGFDRPMHIAAYRVAADEAGVELTGRVLARPPMGGPMENDDWWDNLVNTYRRFDAEHVPDVAVHARFRDASAQTVTDNEGFYRVRLQTEAATNDLLEQGGLWQHASISLADGCET